MVLVYHFLHKINHSAANQAWKWIWSAVLQVTRSRGLWWTHRVVPGPSLCQAKWLSSASSQMWDTGQEKSYGTFYWNLLRLKSDCISSVSHLNTLVIYKGSPLLCTLVSSGNWSYRAHSISSVCRKKYMGNKRFLIKMALPKCQTTMLFHEQYCQSLQLTSTAKWERASGPQEQRKFQCKRLVQGRKETSILPHEQRKWVPLNGSICQKKKSMLERKNPPLNPLLLHPLFWLSTDTHLEVLKRNRDEILAILLLRSILTVLI